MSNDVVNITLNCALEKDSKVHLATSRKYANILTLQPDMPASSVALNPDDAMRMGEALLAWGKTHGGR